MLYNNKSLHFFLFDDCDAHLHFAKQAAEITILVITKNNAGIGCSYVNVLKIHARSKQQCNHIFET
jgi:hypothetical protein